MGTASSSDPAVDFRFSEDMGKGGLHIPREKQAGILKEIREGYKVELDPLSADARLSIDGILDRVETCDAISRGIEMATNNSKIPKLNPGIIQT